MAHHNGSPARPRLTCQSPCPLHRPSEPEIGSGALQVAAQHLLRVEPEFKITEWDARSRWKYPLEENMRAGCVSGSAPMTLAAGASGPSPEVAQRPKAMRRHRGIGCLGKAPG